MILTMYYSSSSAIYLSPIKRFDHSYLLFFISTRYLSRVNLLTQTKMYQGVLRINIYSKEIV
ncbi:hypothetical protein JCM18903_521 [Psychrobacter sp. JCM 18903]|nr:hypothetical protein JCM18903_521 [Psychrobacter sp. JCM 18903]